MDHGLLFLIYYQLFPQNINGLLIAFHVYIQHVHVIIDEGGNEDLVLGLEGSETLSNNSVDASPSSCCFTEKGRSGRGNYYERERESEVWGF